MPTYTLPRDGQRAVRFTGEMLAAVSGRVVQGREQNRWYEVRLFAEQTGRTVVAWEYLTLWQGEEDHAEVQTCATLPEAMNALEAFDPLQWLEGYKALMARHPQDRDEGHASGYAGRQAPLQEQPAEQYGRLVAELARTLDVVEEL